MDVEKICRCCLALSGPLLSIYEGDTGSGRIADMLADICKVKPKQNDQMPEKVCLACISEINRCYVFKIKCESSNKTLRQLLPNAPKEECFAVPEVSPQLTDVAVQTEEKSMECREVQTLEVPKCITVHREIQTEALELSTGSALKRRRSVSPHKKSLVENIKSCIEDDLELIEVDEQHEDNDESMNKEIEQESELNLEENFDVKCDTSTSRFDYYDDEIIENNEHKSPCYHENYTFVEMPLEAASSKDTKDFVNDVTGASLLESVNTTAQEKPALTKKQNSSKHREQYKCSLCIMTFVSLKVLRRHLAKRHSIIDADIVVDESSPAEMPSLENVIDAPDQQLPQDQVELTMDNVIRKTLLPRGKTAQTVDVDRSQKHFKHYCGYCRAGFAQRKTLTYHMKQNLCTASNFQCNECDRIFLTQDNLDTHKVTHSQEHICLECHKKCSSVEDLSEHMIEEHNRNARNQCTICKKVFTMKASLTDHLRIHSDEKPFLCTVCGKSFRQNSNLKQHLMRHTNEKNYKCDVCPNTYVTKAELFSHKRTHTGDHPFKCEICSTSFTSSSSLQKHMRKHTGERPYSCEFCPLRFSALNVLKNHRRTHSGEKPYKCSFCDRRFTQKGDCLLHQRTHEFGDVKCFCGSTFSKISNLRQHIKNKHPNMTDEKQRELNVALHKPKYTDDSTQLQITLLENDEYMEDESQTSNFDTFDNEDTTEIIMEHIS